MLIPFLLLLHVLVAVGLIGAITHQAVAALRPPAPTGRISFAGRYRAVNAGLFARTVVGLYLASIVLGAVIYPTYRLDARIALEEMGLAWAVGLFELKEHWGGLGLALLPLYALYWRTADTHDNRGPRIAATWLLAFVVWFDFIVGHVLNNLRGL
ncbi:MAG: hypothetical protein WCY11_02025 [Novosphingobium sp.]